MKTPSDALPGPASRTGGVAPPPPERPLRAASTSSMPFEQLPALLNPQLVFHGSRAQGITLASPSWLAFTGLTAQEAQGWSFAQSIHPEDLAKFLHLPPPAPAAPAADSAARSAPSPASHSSQSSSKAASSSDITLLGRERSPRLGVRDASPPAPSSKWLGHEIAGIPAFSPSPKTAAAIQAKLMSERDVAATKAEFKQLSSSFSPSRFWSAVGAPDITSALKDKPRSSSSAVALDIPESRLQLTEIPESGPPTNPLRPRTLERTISELSLAARLPLPPSPSVDRESYLLPIGEGSERQELPALLKSSALSLNELIETQVLKVASDSTGRIVYVAEVRLRSHSGQYLWHSIRCSPPDVIDGDGPWIGTCTDINEHKTLEKELIRAMESKSRFLSNMSHEIRTPLIGITGMVHFLLDTTLTEEQMDFCDTIMTSSRGLLLVINDILDLSKVEAGMMTLTMGWFHIRSVVEDVNEILSPLARDKRLELNYIIDEDVPAMVKGDRLRIRQVLLNVIGNALKFTTTGEVFSHCKVHRGGEATSANANEVVISYEVIDTGRGFSEEQAKLMFKPFSQIDFDGGSPAAYSGSGLGLVISRQLVELHGGSMHAFSTPEKGSTFDFTAKFLLPSDDDFPNPSVLEEEYRLHEQTAFPSLSSQTSGKPRRLLESDPNGPLIASMLSQSPAGSHSVRQAWDSPGPGSSASSVPSLPSSNTIRSELSSASSILPAVTPLVQQAIAANMPDITLALPGPAGKDQTPGTLIAAASPAAITLPFVSGKLLLQSTALLHPPMYSIMVVCPYSYAREAIVQHIERTLSKGIPHQITAQASLAESQKMIGREDPVLFTHIVLNLNETREVVEMMDHISRSLTLPSTCVVIICDPTQRAEIMNEASAHDFEALSKTNRMQFIYKPVKPSRFSAIFDPAKERELSSDRNRSTAQRVAENQKQVFIDMEKLVGHRGYRVLLVEDNPVNQKVILKFLSKVGLAVDTAVDGVEGMEKVVSKEPGYYSVVLSYQVPAWGGIQCDLHMPRKDGYQTCREIRQWETANQHPRMPIIALSANVMADVVEKCVEAGFSNYVTKPVDFGELSRSITEMLAPSSSSAEPPSSAAAT
ncbi:MAG: hypothetical protein M1829_002631 [Trizodia sp. TS-e1964]|nr:MAG: hypothetical protein M1829_002631 [Trizodia sp. TS-e1964]